MNFLTEAVRHLLDPANTAVLTQRVSEHLLYSFLALSVAMAVGLPLGLWLGHRRTGSSAILAFSGALRAMPTLGLLTFLTVQLSFGIRLPLIPAIIVLVVLAIPPVLANSFSGIAAIPVSIVDSARAVGHTEFQILRRVELPLAGATIVGGVRSGMVQVMASATVASYIGLGGLGRLILDGLAVQDYARMVAGALVIIALTLLIDAALAVVQRAVRPAGVRGRSARRR